MSRKLILLELNEVPYRVLDMYCMRRPASTLTRLLAASRQYETVTDDRIALDPWISWATLHRGVSDEVHGVYHLGQPLTDVDAQFPPIWQILCNQHRRVGVFGSLHSSSVPHNVSDYTFYLPDYFGSTVYANPNELMAFQELNLAMTRESARNVTRKIPPQALLRFLLTMPRLGLRLSTVADVLQQLVREFRSDHLRIRRRAYQPLLMMDVFIRQLGTSKPDFATFYTNHVAAAMHRYWGALFPEDYGKDALDRQWIDRYRDEILFAMDKLDVMLERLARFVASNDDYLMMVASSMGQAAIPAQRTNEFLTITDTGKFMAALGVPTGEWQDRPAMVPCCCVVVKPEHRDLLLSRLQSLTIDGQRMCRDRRPVAAMCYDEREHGFFQFFVQFDGYQGARQALLDGRPVGLAELGLGLMAHEDGVNCTAQHVPVGSLWVYDPRRPKPAALDRERVSVLDIVPSILRLFDVAAPGYMSGAAAIGLAG